MLLVLASKSPRRKQILELFEFAFAVKPANVNERSVSKESVEELTKTIARMKAEKIAKNYPKDAVIGVDTMLCKDSKIIGQPASEANAKQIMSKLFGKWHTVCSGYCVIKEEQKVCGNLKSRLKLKNVSENTFKEYIASGQWRGKAGGYNITDPEFENFVEKVEGSKLNIVGLPAEKLLLVIEAVTGQKRKKTVEWVEFELFKGKL